MMKTRLRSNTPVPPYRNTKFTAYAAQLYADVCHIDSAFMWWQIGERHRDIVENAIDHSGVLVYDKPRNRLMGISVQWMDGTQVELKASLR